MRNKMESIMHKLVALPISLSIAFAVSLQGTSTPSRFELDHQQLSSSKVEEIHPEFELAKDVQDIAYNEGNKTITAFDKEHIYFNKEEKEKENCNKGRRKDNCRIVTDTVSFPNTDHSYEKVTMRLKLECPDTNDPKQPSDWQNCDWWDRTGYVAVVKPDGTKIELMRFMTPYGLPGEWSLDVTSLQPLLKGNVQLELFIDTWTQPRNEYGNGWLATVSFDFEGSPSPGQPVPVEVIPLWNEQKLVVGDPNSDKSIDKLINSARVIIPAEASRVELRSLITGHGQGNTNNCAEWCPLKHTYSIDGTLFDPFAPNSIMRDCSNAPFGVNSTHLEAHKSKRKTNWNGNRAGWCPGDIVQPWVEDVTEAAKPDTTVQVNYEIEKYINTLSSGYDEGNHTEPFYRTSAVLVIYK
jgi:hypothetical protein